MKVTNILIIIQSTFPLMFTLSVLSVGINSYSILISAMPFLIAVPYTTEQSNLITVARYVVMCHCPLVCHIINYVNNQKSCQSANYCSVTVPIKSIQLPLDFYMFCCSTTVNQGGFN